MSRNIEALSHNHCCHGEAKSIGILSVPEALVIRLAKHMRPIILLSVILSFSPSNHQYDVGHVKFGLQSLHFIKKQSFTLHIT